MILDIISIICLDLSYVKRWGGFMKIIDGPLSNGELEAFFDDVIIAFITTGIDMYVTIWNMHIIPTTYMSQILNSICVFYETPYHH